MISSGFAELVSLGSVLPLLAAITDPQNLLSISLIKNLASFLGVTESNDIIVSVIVVFSLLSVCTAFVRLYTLRYLGLVSSGIGSELSIESFRRTLYQPYDVHIKNNSSVFITA